MSADVLALVLRALGFVGLFQTAGATCFLAVFGNVTAALQAADLKTD